MRISTLSSATIVLTVLLVLILGNVGASHGSNSGKGLKNGHTKKIYNSLSGNHGRKIGHGNVPYYPKPVKTPPTRSTPSPSPPSSPSTPSPSPPPPTPSIPPPSPPPTRPSGLRVGFYRGLCPNKNVDVEASIATKVREEFIKDPSIVPALLRMQFHDCFVNGCDASILIDGTSSEKTAGPNLSVRGYEFIDKLKSIVELECPDLVSCADIIAIATKEVIKQGGGPDYLVQTGRLDGIRSNANDVNLPSPFGTLEQSISAFGAHNFNPEEMVVLLGCHTVGKSHCAFFQDRLYQGTSQFDPNMDPNLRRQLIQTCPQGTNANNFTSLDQNPQSSNVMDNSFYDQIMKKRGIFRIDQELGSDPATKDFVVQLARSPALFNSKLASVMIKMQALGGKTGEVRKFCRRFN